MPLRWGICGAGQISNDFVNAMQLILNANEPVAVAARSLERAQEFSKKFNIRKAYGSYEELAQDDEIDVIYVGTIHPEHRNNVLLFIQHGKHVLCEKPLGMSLSEVKEMIEAAKSKGVFLMEGYWSRMTPVYAKIREELRKDSIGSVRKVHAHHEFNLINDDGTAKGWYNSILRVLGVYPLQLALMAFNGDKPLRWSADCTLTKDGLDESINMTLIYSDNRVAFLTAHQGVNGSSSAGIYGTKGSIEIPKLMWAPTELIINGEQLNFPLPDGTAPHPFLFPNSANFVHQIEHVRHCLEKKMTESDLVPFEDSLWIMEMTENMLKSLNVKSTQ